MSFEKAKDTSSSTNNTPIVKLKSGTLEEVSYDCSKFQFTNRTILIGLHNNDPEFNQTVFYIQNIRKNDGKSNIDVINEYIDQNPDKLIFADPNNVIPSARVAKIANNQKMLLEYIENTRKTLFDCKFVEVFFNRKFHKLLSAIFIYPNKAGEDFIKKYTKDNVLIESVIR